MVDIPKNRIPPAPGPAERADACTSHGQTIHVPIQPHIPSETRHAAQRYYARNAYPTAHSMELAPHHRSGHDWSCIDLTVWRHAPDSFARLEIAQENRLSKSETRVNLDVTELRELAARLLDAAHDLETNTSAKLMNELQKGGES